MSPGTALALLGGAGVLAIIFEKQIVAEFHTLATKAGLPGAAGQAVPTPGAPALVPPSAGPSGPTVAQPSHEGSAVHSNPQALPDITRVQRANTNPFALGLTINQLLGV